MQLIDTYEHKGEGFTPMFINKKWQVAQINFDPNDEEIRVIDIHFETDELFVLLEGNAVLIAAELSAAGVFTYEATNMESNIVYNIPRMTWHNISLLPGAKVLIFEDKDSHLGKYKRKPLAEGQIAELEDLINETINKGNAN